MQVQPHCLSIVLQLHGARGCSCFSDSAWTHLADAEMELVNPARGNPIPPTFALCFSALGEDALALQRVLGPRHCGAPYNDTREVQQKSFHLQFWACAGYTGSPLFPSTVTLMLSAVRHSTCIIWVCHSSGVAAPPLLQIMESNCWTK